MKEQIAALWRARPRMSKGMKLARNLIILALAVLIFWWGHRCPALSEQGAIEKLTRELMLPEGDVALWGKEVSEDYWVLVMGENYAYVARTYHATLAPWVRAQLSEGAKLDGEYVLLRCPEATRDGLDADRQKGTRMMICPKGPERAKSCILKIRQSYCDAEGVLKTAEYVMEAQRGASGEYLFKWSCEDTNAWWAADILWKQCGVPQNKGANYSLYFYDTHGTLLEHQEGQFTYKW